MGLKPPPQSFIAALLQGQILNIFYSLGQPDPSTAQKLLTQHLVKVGQGNFLYLRLCLDLIDQRAIVLKSAGFKVVPINLHEVCSKNQIFIGACTRGILPKRVTSGGVHLRCLAPWQYSCGETSQQWRAVGDTVLI